MKKKKRRKNTSKYEYDIKTILAVRPLSKRKIKLKQ